MTDGFHLIWREQVAALPDIQRNFGLGAAFNYIIGEKLFQFAEAAERHPTFARELPNFVAALRRLFSPDMMAAGLARIEATLDEDEAELELRASRGLEESDDDHFDMDTPETLSAKRQRFEHLRDLLVAEQLGTA